MTPQMFRLVGWVCGFAIIILSTKILTGPESITSILNEWRGSPRACGEYGMQVAARKVVIDLTLTEAARIIVTDSIKPPEGSWKDSTVLEQVKDLGGNFATTTILVSVGDDSFTQALSGWRDFPLDCANTMNPEWTHYGTAFDPTSHTWVLIGGNR
jgi:uncharacterized protein YkwD